MPSKRPPPQSGEAPEQKKNAGGRPKIDVDVAVFLVMQKNCSPSYALGQQLLLNERNKKPLPCMRTLGRALAEARDSEAAEKAAQQLKQDKRLALQIYGTRKAHGKVFLLRGEAVVMGDLGPKRAGGGKQFLCPDDKGNASTRSRYTSEDKRKFAKEKVSLTAEYALAFQKACVYLMEANEANTGGTAEECCLRAELEHDFPAGCVLSPTRIEQVVSSACGVQDMTPQRRGPKVDDALEEAILDEVLSNVEVNAIKGLQSCPADVTGRAQSLFRVTGLPCKSKHYIWNKLRERRPEVCRCVAAADGRDHLRLLWTTCDNLNIWHPGYVSVAILLVALHSMRCQCSLLTVTFHECAATRAGTRGRWRRWGSGCWAPNTSWR